MSRLSSRDCGVLFLMFFLKRVFYSFWVNWGYFVFICCSFNAALGCCLDQAAFQKEVIASQRGRPG